MSRRTRSSDPADGPPPIDATGLERLALRYVERYATTRARLGTYLARKVRERGGADGLDAAIVIAALVERVAALGYVDDLAFAQLRDASLARRGYGARRRRESLRAAGVGADDLTTVASERADAGGWRSAITLARRRRFGPFAEAPADPDRRRRQLGAMLRAGHDLTIARSIVDAAPGEMPVGMPDEDAD